jgi:hypothetical protein
MPKFIVRFREIFIYEAEVEAATLREASHVFSDKLASEQIYPEPEQKGLRYEIETIKLGEDNDHKFYREPDPPPKRNKKSPKKVYDCESHDFESGFF